MITVSHGVRGMKPIAVDGHYCFEAFKLGAEWIVRITASGEEIGRCTKFRKIEFVVADYLRTRAVPVNPVTDWSSK